MRRSCFLWRVDKRRPSRPIWAGLLIGLLGGLLFSGCSRPQTNSLPGGKSAVTENGRGAKKPATVESKAGQLPRPGGGKAATVIGGKGKVEIKRGVSEKEMGLAFYPGAKVQQSILASRDMDEKAGAMKHVLMTTPDSVAKVKAFYLKQYPKAKSMDMNSPQVSMAQLIVQDTKEQKYIMITRKAKEDRTSVMLHVTRLK
jgi:hypothetical protein